MSFLTIAVVALVFGLVVVFAVALVSYLSSLVKSAYQIKVEMRNDLEEGLKKMDDELNKRSKWLKREMIEEMEKIKAAMASDTAKRQAEMGEQLTGLVKEIDARLQAAHADNMARIDEYRLRLDDNDRKLAEYRRENRAVIDTLTGVQPQPVSAEASPPAPATAAALPPPSEMPMPPMSAEPAVIEKA